jgi:hypothetical protein
MREAGHWRLPIPRSLASSCQVPRSGRESGFEPCCCTSEKCAVCFVIAPVPAKAPDAGPSRAAAFKAGCTEYERFSRVKDRQTRDFCNRLSAAMLRSERRVGWSRKTPPRAWEGMPYCSGATSRVAHFFQVRGGMEPLRQPDHAEPDAAATARRSIAFGVDLPLI